MTRFVLVPMLSLGLVAGASAQTPQTPPQTPPPAVQTPQQQTAPAAPTAPYKLSGQVFGDYYYFASDHLDKWEDQHGLWLRRGYFTYDHTFTPRLSARLRLEMNSNGKLAGGAITPFLKDAYLRWVFSGRQALTIGLQPSLTFDYVESIWGLRHIEKTPLDLYRWDSSRDTGLTLSGPLNASQSVRYAVQYGNESGSNAEVDPHKGYRASVRYDTNPGFSVEGVYAHFDRGDDADRITAQLFGAYRAARGRAGLQYSFQRRRAPDGSTGSDRDMRVLSGFGVADLIAKKTSLFARVDRHADPCADCAGIDYLPIDPSVPFTMTLAGIEQAVHPSFRVSPNVEWVRYDSPGTGRAEPKSDVVLRLTFNWVF